MNSWNISVTCTRFFLSSLNVWRGHVDIWFENILEKIKNLPFLLSSLPILPSRTNRQGYSGVFYLKTEFQNFTGCSGKIRAVQDIFHFWIGKVYVGTLLWAQKETDYHTWLGETKFYASIGNTTNRFEWWKLRVNQRIEYCNNFWPSNTGFKHVRPNSNSKAHQCTARNEEAGYTRLSWFLYEFLMLIDFPYRRNIIKT